MLQWSRMTFDLKTTFSAQGWLCLEANQAAAKTPGRTPKSVCPGSPIIGHVLRDACVRCAAASFRTPPPAAGALIEYLAPMVAASFAGGRRCRSTRDVPPAMMCPAARVLCCRAWRRRRSARSTSRRWRRPCLKHFLFFYSKILVF